MSKFIKFNGTLPEGFPPEVYSVFTESNKNKEIYSGNCYIPEGTKINELKVMRTYSFFHLLERKNVYISCISDEYYKMDWDGFEEFYKKFVRKEYVVTQMILTSIKNDYDCFPIMCKDDPNQKYHDYVIKFRENYIANQKEKYYKIIDFIFSWWWVPIAVACVAFIIYFLIKEIIFIVICFGVYACLASSNKKFYSSSTSSNNSCDCGSDTYTHPDTGEQCCTNADGSLTSQGITSYSWTTDGGESGDISHHASFTTDDYGNTTCTDDCCTSTPSDGS